MIKASNSKTTGKVVREAINIRGGKRHGKESTRRTFRNILLFGTVLALSFNPLHAQPQSSLSSISLNLEAATDAQAMMEALATVAPVPFDSLPRDRLNRVLSVGYWSAQHLPGSRAPWPPLPENFWNLDVWSLGGGVFILDDRRVDYIQIQALADAAAALASPSLMMRSSLMMSSLSSSYACGNPVYFDAETERDLVFLTNHLEIPALTATLIYRLRWRIELFLRWIKGPLRIKHYFGTSPNAVKTQIWIAITTYLMVAIIHKQLNLPGTWHRTLQLLSVHPFENTSLHELLTETEFNSPPTPNSNQLLLLIYSRTRVVYNIRNRSSLASTARAFFPVPVNAGTVLPENYASRKLLFRNRIKR